MNVLINTKATEGNFVDKVTVQMIEQIEQIKWIPLAQPRLVKGYNEQPGHTITYAIYPKLQVLDYIEDLCPLLITELGSHPLILGKAWMKRHGAVLDLSTESLIFYKDYCDHPGAPKSVPPCTTEAKQSGTKT